MSRKRPHVAILQTAFLGDALLSIPLAKALIENGCAVVFICRAEFVELFASLGIFDSVLGIKKGDSGSYRRVKKELETLHQSGLPLTLVSPHESHRSKFFALSLRLSGVVDRTIGYSDRKFNFGLSRWAYSDRVNRSMNLPEALRQIQLLTVQAFDFQGKFFSLIEEFKQTQELSGGRRADGSLLPVPSWASMTLKLNAHEKTKLAVLAPGSVWPTKQWTRAGFVELGRRFLKQGFQVLVTGAASETEVCDSIASDIGGGAASLAGRISLLETVRRVAGAHIAVVNDSGTMHIAAMVGTPSVAIFGPTVLDFGYRPWSTVGQVVEPPTKLACRPCGLHGSLECPIGTHECMRSIDADVVWTKVQEVLR